MKTLRLIPVLAVLSALCACSTIDTRIAQHHSTYAAATPRDQFLMRRGLVSVGFTEEMVLIAIDKPDTVFKEPKEHLERWTYRNFNSGAPNSNMGGTRIQTNWNEGFSTPPHIRFGNEPGQAQEPQRLAGPRAVNTYDARPKLADAGQITSQHLVVTFIEGKVAAMELITI